MIIVDESDPEGGKYYYTKWTIFIKFIENNFDKKSEQMQAIWFDVANRRRRWARDIIENDSERWMWMQTKWERCVFNTFTKIARVICDKPSINCAKYLDDTW